MSSFALPSLLVFNSNYYPAAELRAAVFFTQPPKQFTLPHIDLTIRFVLNKTKANPT